MKSKKLLNRRQWLRPARSWGPESTIHTSVDLDVYTHTKKDKTEVTSHRIEGLLVLRDCSNRVSFDFESGNLKQARAQMEMLNTLQREITTLRDTYLGAIDSLINEGVW